MCLIKEKKYFVRGCERAKNVTQNKRKNKARTYLLNGLFACKTNFGEFLQKTFGAHGLSVFLVERGAGDGILAHLAHKMIGMPGLAECGQNLRLPEKKKKTFRYIVKKVKIQRNKFLNIFTYMTTYPSANSCITFTAKSVSLRKMKNE